MNPISQTIKPLLDAIHYGGPIIGVLIVAVLYLRTKWAASRAAKW